MRCNSPIPTNQHTGATPSPPSAFPTLSIELWHCRLGYPRAPVLNSLHRNKFLLCNKFRDDFFCQSCPLGKQIKLSLQFSVIYLYAF